MSEIADLAEMATYYIAIIADYPYSRMASVAEMIEISM